MLTLNVEKREKGKDAQLRAAGMLLGVVYGAHQEATSIAVPAAAFGKVFRQAGEATIVSLVGLSEPIATLIHEVDLDPITNLPRHVDFYAVTKGKHVEVTIKLIFTGTPSLARAGANLVKVMHEVEVEADPMNLPQDISVDISTLSAVGDTIRAGDIILPSGTKLVTLPEEVIAIVKEVAEERVIAPKDIASIEVEKKGKAEVEGETAPAKK